LRRRGRAASSRGSIVIDRRIPERQRIEIARDAFAIARGRLRRTVILGGKAKRLQPFRIQLEHDRVGRTDETQRLGPGKVIAVRHLVVAPRCRHRRVPVAIVCLVYIELMRIRFADAAAAAIAAAPAGQ
jgi:hypothetical protein